MSRRFVRTVARVGILAAAVTVLLQPLHAQAGRVIVLQHADSLEGRVIGGEDAREFIGNVSILQENVRITCDRAIQFATSGRVLLTGNVVVRDDSVTMRAPRGVYHRDDRRAEAFDRVNLDDGTVQLTAGYGEYFVEEQRAFFHTGVVVHDTASVVTSDSLTYFRSERRSLALGHVTIHNPADNVTITGGRLDHDAARQYSRMTVNPVLVQRDSASSGRVDTLVVRSLVMESYRDSIRRMIATDSVQIVRSDLAGIAQYAVFFTRDDSILLRHAPVVWYQRTQVSGDSINVYLKARMLRVVRVMGNAFAISQSDTLYPKRFDQLTGDQMRMDFVNRVLERIDVETRAISVYHLYEDSLGNGLNRTSGDRIVMMFEDGKIKTIRITGGVEGSYYPENMVAGREREYAIAGFLWRENRPRIHPADMEERSARVMP